MVRPVVDATLEVLTNTPSKRVEDALLEYAKKDEQKKEQVELAEAVTSRLDETHWKLLIGQARLAEEVSLATRARRVRLAQQMQAAIAVLLNWPSGGESLRTTLLCLGLSGELAGEIVRGREDNMADFERLKIVLDICVHPYARLAFQLAFAALSPNQEGKQQQLAELLRDFGPLDFVDDLVDAKGSADERLAVAMHAVAKLASIA